MVKRTFGTNKTYAKNYLNKVRQNNKVSFCAMMLSAQDKGYIVIYGYKK